MRWRYVALGVVLAGAVLFARQLTGTSAASPSGAMALDCDAATPGIQTSCTYGWGATFSVQVHVTKAPIEGYFGFQAKLRWTEDVLDYLPTNDPMDEALWPACGLAARANNSEGLPSLPIEPSMLWGCVPFPAISEGDTFLGAVMEVAFQCGEESYTLLELVAGAPAGTYFIDDSLVPIEPALTDVEIGCGIDPPTPTPCLPAGCPTATPTPSATPTFTPRPTATPCPPDGCSNALGPIGVFPDVDGPNPSAPNAPGVAETATAAVTPSPVSLTPSPLPETLKLTDVAGVGVRALPQTGLSLGGRDNDLRLSISVALAALAALAAGVGVLRFRRRGRF